MLSRRLIFGTLIIAVLLLLSWLDVIISHYGAKKEILWLPKGMVLLPVYLGCLILLTREVLRILDAAGLHPFDPTVYLGNILVAASCWFANVYQQFKIDILGETASKGGWHWAVTSSYCALFALAVGVIICFAAEMRRYHHPGGVTINLSGAVFAIAYLGLLSCFMIQLYMAYGIWAVLSLVVITKLCDIGAFAVGSLVGRHKMTPLLSPGKTIEGAIGGILFSCVGAWFWFDIILIRFDNVHRTPVLGWLAFGIVIAVVGMVGDLGGSLIKRDSKMKDSGHSVPGFGGVLDVFDSLLMAAPAAYFFWTFRIVCP
ncbi:MAG: phosphatidate cytidylyltransferase [Planctomycetaceae bacterium]|jgi:phosphatidate cytidylyltransferase|nr:phosphatidate cytidylyltransferase [Planctomycetaceae bacterium]